MSVEHTKNIIEVKDVSFRYGSEDVLEDITFEIHEGDYLGVVGPNGAGKTTLVKIILGLLQPTSGSVHLFGQDIKKFKDWSKVGYVPQKAIHFDTNFPVTAKEVVEMVRHAKRGIFQKIQKRDTEIVEQSLKEVEMWDLRDRLIGDLSGGQQQRIFIARALAGEPEIVFFDEPTVGVDRKTQNEFYALVKRLNKNSHLTVVLISHDIERITEEAMHIACVNKTLVCHTSAKEFLEESESLDILGHKVKVIHHHHN